MIKHLVLFHFKSENISFLAEYRSENVMDKEIEDAIASYAEANPNQFKDKKSCEKAVSDIMGSFKDLVWQFLYLHKFDI